MCGRRGPYWATRRRLGSDGTVEAVLAVVSDSGTGSGGPDGSTWWIASDGRWYPPETHPQYDRPPPPPPPPPPSHPAFPTLPLLMPQPRPPYRAPFPALGARAAFPPLGSQSAAASHPGPAYRPRSAYRPGSVPPARRPASLAPVGIERIPSPIRRLTVAVVMLATLAATWFVAPRLSTWTLTMSAFAGVFPAGPPNPMPPLLASGGTAGAVNVVNATVIVDALGCGPTDGYLRGSVWPVATHDIVTATHVVAGRVGMAVLLPGQPLLVASVASSDAADDLALISVPGAHDSPLAVGADPGGPVAALFIGSPGISGSNETDLAGTVNGGSVVDDT